MPRTELPCRLTLIQQAEGPRSHGEIQSRSKSRRGFSTGASLAFLRPSANFRARTSSFIFSASTEARNFASTASVCSRSSRAVSSRSMEGAFAGGTCDNTTPSERSIVSFAWQHGQSASNVSVGFFPMPVFYANFCPAREPSPKPRARRDRPVTGLFQIGKGPKLKIPPEAVDISQQGARPEMRAASSDQRWLGHPSDNQFLR